MMKLACFRDTEASPIRKPFKPALSISRAACCPGGLVNTEPQLHSPMGCVCLRLSSSSRMARAAAIDHVDFEHLPPGLAVPGPGVHRQGAAQGARDPGKELGGPQT